MFRNTCTISYTESCMPCPNRGFKVQTKFRQKHNQAIHELGTLPWSDLFLLFRQQRSRSGGARAPPISAAQVLQAPLLPAKNLHRNSKSVRDLCFTLKFAETRATPARDKICAPVNPPTTTKYAKAGSGMLLQSSFAAYGVQSRHHQSTHQFASAYHESVYILLVP